MTRVTRPTMSKLFRGDAGATTGTTSSRFPSLRSSKSSALVAQNKANYEKFLTIVNRLWEFELDSSPEMATIYGYPGRDDKLRSWTKEAFSSKVQTFESALVAVDRLFPEGDESALVGLPDQSSLTVFLFKEVYRKEIKAIELEVHAYSVNSMVGPHSILAMVVNKHSFTNMEDFENYKSRLEQVPRFLNELSDMLLDCARRGVAPPKICVESVPASITKFVLAEPSVFHLPVIKHFDRVCTGKAAKALRSSLERVIGMYVLPALVKFANMLEKDYIPLLRDSIAATDAVNGPEYYSAMLEKYTSLPISADEIHDLGLSEVKRIKEQMFTLAQEAGYTGPDAVDRFNADLQADGQHVAKTEEELLDYYRAGFMEIYPRLPELFKILPRVPCAIEKIPDFRAATSPGAYFQRPAMDGKTPGVFNLNCSHLESRKKYCRDAILLHEAIPGHHFQIARQTEIQDVPSFRKHSGYTAYIEGWGMHSEKLGEELGMYKTTEAKFGGLSMEMLRACRLVVDTGMHHKGWSKEQAMEYMLDNKAGNKTEIDAETTRYLSLPGQAVSYKVGELTIKRLKAHAKEQLGSKFDIREFHEVILARGAISLTLLEKFVEEYIAENK